MYLKLSANNERFQVKFLSDSGEEVIPNSTITTILYNKINSNYIPFQTETTSNFTYSTKNITDKDTIYADISIGGISYKTKVKVSIINSENILRYNVTYDSSYAVRKLSNKFLRRVSMGMPQWSTAYKNDVSVYSKTFYPLYLLPEKLFYKTNEALSKNLRNIKHSKPIQIKQPISIAKQGSKIIPKTFIKEKEIITSIIKTPIKQKGANLVQFDQDSSFPVKLDKVFGTVFIRSDKECFVIIKGINQDRRHISETLYCDGVIYSGSLLKYKEVIDLSYVVSSNEVDSVALDCTNYMSLEKYQNNFRKNYIITDGVNHTKDLDVPLYTYNSDTQTVNTFYGKVFKEEVDYLDSYYIPEMEGHRGFFVTEEDDLIFLQTTALRSEDGRNILSEDSLPILTDGPLSQIYVGILNTNISSNMPLHSSNNNNSIVTLLDGNVMEDNQVEFQITCKDLVEEYGNISVIISINVDGKIYYLSDDNEWVTDKVFKFLYNKNPIYISYDTTGIQYISVVVECNEVPYQSSIVKNRIDIEGTGVLVEKLYHNGTDFIGTNGNQLYTITPVKEYYEFNDDTNISYDNYNKNTTLINIKGQLDGEYLN